MNSPDMVKTPTRTATISFSDGSPSVDLPIYAGTMGPDVIDIKSLYGKTGKFTYDPGFMSTASCKSAITFIDGDEGILLYRGYPIEQLAEKCDFLEVCYLLLKGELPNLGQKREWDDRIRKHTMAHEQLTRFYSGFRRDAHPMAVMGGWWGRCRPSITTPWTSITPSIARSPLSACWPRCRPSQP